MFSDSLNGLIFMSGPFIILNSNSINTVALNKMKTVEKVHL